MMKNSASVASGPITPSSDDLHTSLAGLLQQRFCLDAFRPHQERVCQAVVGGHDVLLVMPTGAGKSLCYQLPGLARGGTTLVISPLIALMEDQVCKLQALGMRAERIHSGRDRLSSRQVCVRYLRGELDYLFIAPERLRVPGFAEMLAKRPLALIAVDEAHCISQWGHDFRPDYRLLGQRLPLLRPAPIIALTATATRQVQDDILEQLGARSALRHIYGFRRSNLAIEVVEVPRPRRLGVVPKLLDDPARRPAIVYAPTRRDAEAFGEALAQRYPAAAYHAGLEAAEREAIQSRFQSGALEVVVATIAFGMGVDKPDVRTIIHAALPSSIEGYYQEIGRAGRDGLPARAILLYSYADRRTHDYFQGQNYPPSHHLQALHQALNDDPQPLDLLRDYLGQEPALFERVVEKLCVHGGAVLDNNGYLRRGGMPHWLAAYEQQGQHNQRQVDEMFSYAEATDCRMVRLVQHFGDADDGYQPCGICDHCQPPACVARRERPPTACEQRFIRRLQEALRECDGQPAGRLFQALTQELAVNRRAYDRLLTGLAQAGWLRIVEERFEKKGRFITYRRVYLTPRGHRQEIIAASVQLLDPVESL